MTVMTFIWEHRIVSFHAGQADATFRGTASSYSASDMSTCGSEMHAIMLVERRACLWLKEKILLKLPEEDQLSAVTQILLAMEAEEKAKRCCCQVDVYTNTSGNLSFRVNRTNVREGGEAGLLRS